MGRHEEDIPLLRRQEVGWMKRFKNKKGIMAMKMCVLQWLEETARKYPDKTAFVDERVS